MHIPLPELGFELGDAQPFDVDYTRPWMELTQIMIDTTGYDFFHR